SLATSAVPVLLLPDMRVITQSHGHRVLDRPRNDHARVLARVDEVRDDPRVAGDEGGTVAGEVGLLGQGVYREQARQVAARDRGVQDGRYGTATPGFVPVSPSQFRIAFVGSDHGAAVT